ncbi:class I SAM-dependent methyltransferase [Nitrosomonas sp.]|uniref:class I SAM-dependent methyltransferase n=1 Tax=Nitrosomonas sp. TaxID=42353 RepID=UPI0020837556|nr:SAM-dependent methyltransferase [Nitrosomonas sp.]GJL76208.1 MAG: SAM-dependent methyltransferase [Nitrosomonas sp.]
MTALSKLSTLPACSEIALAHSQKLQSVIRDEIESAGGWISFSRYMDKVLYHPGLGYYSGGATKLGGSGDFVTAPEISALYGRTLARQVRQIAEHVSKHTGFADMLEFGAGSGKLALDLLQELEQLDALPQYYYILEVSAQLRKRQQKLLAEQASHLMARVVWLDRLPDRYYGTVLANEVIDAMPVHLVEWRSNEVFERGVAWNDHEQNGGFVWENRPIENEALKFHAKLLSARMNPDQDPAFNYVSEVNLAARYFMRSLAGMLEQGAAILIDYGFGSGEYYHPQRSQGTLMCHYRHHAHPDPFFLPGLQDITSHVDFSALTEIAEETELSLMGYTTQAHFLLNCGVTEILARIPVEDVQNYLPTANQLQKLVSPAEMGELFKVIAFGRNIAQPLVGFVSGDKSRML